MQTFSSSTGQNNVLRIQSPKKNSFLCQQLQSVLFIFFLIASQWSPCIHWSKSHQKHSSTLRNTMMTKHPFILNAGQRKPQFIPLQWNHWGKNKFCILDFWDEGSLRTSMTRHTTSRARLYSCHTTVSEALLASISQARRLSRYKRDTLWVNAEVLGLI